MLQPLDKLDIIITIFNQEEIIEKVIYSIFRNTTTSFDLILVFDGCTDRTKPRALKYIKKVKPPLLRELIVRDTPNLFELRANNFAFKLARNNYLITVQDDMVINEYGWERRLTYPLRKFDDVLAVTARIAENIKTIGMEKEEHGNSAGLELNTLPRNIFAVRDVINRGPIAFRADYLKELNYLNDIYAPGAKDDSEISLRAWIQKRWKVGAFWIRYISKQEWSKVNAPDSTMKAWESCSRNQIRIYEDFKEYLDSMIKHDEDITIKEGEVDYIAEKYSFLNKIMWVGKYPLRVDRRYIKTLWQMKKRYMAEIVKSYILKLLQIIIGTRLGELSRQYGFKKAIYLFLKENMVR